jgi:hypothetical protein
MLSVGCRTDFFAQQDIDLEKMFKSHEIIQVDSRVFFNEISSKRNGGQFYFLR